MRNSILLIMIAALVGAGAVVYAGNMLLQPPRDLLVTAGFSHDLITPNADGDQDITVFSYELAADALVSLSLENEAGDRYFFRDRQPRGAGQYSVQFSGVVEGYTLPGEVIAGTVLRRLIPDGVYTWQFTAVAQVDGPDDSRVDGESMSLTGTLTVRDADSPLPELVEFSVFPTVFSPNQDGIADRTQVNVALTKDAELDVYLLNETGEREFMPLRDVGREPGEAGRQMYDYEGGVDIGADPPPDGLYTVVARAQDAAGQVVERRAELTIVDGGKPRAEIAAQRTGPTVIFEAQPYDERFYTDASTTGDDVAPPESLSIQPLTMQVGDMLVFRLRVINYGLAPIRTSGPPPGTVYQQTQTDAALGWFEQSGVWRVGIQCETSSESYPWRWAIGPEEDLVTQVAPDGEVFYYLPPGESADVWGAIRMTEVLTAQNPQYCWAGLIHEDVEISL
ncbi:hypothetical protein HC928_22975, partial [bacterium]|nr:hypothetical protein [bacterium]